VGGHDDSEVADLVKKLDYIPLAISQAASHIAERAGRMTIAKYLVELDILDQKSFKVLEASIDESHRDDGRSNSVVATWMVLFRYPNNDALSSATAVANVSLRSA
jgi:hypothetical protein